MEVLPLETPGKFVQRYAVTGTFSIHLGAVGKNMKNFANICR